MCLEIKGSHIWKTKNIPVIFSSNKPLEEWYMKKDKIATDHDRSCLEAVQARFLVVELTNRTPVLATIAPPE